VEAAFLDVGGPIAEIHIHVVDLLCVEFEDVDVRGRVSTVFVPVPFDPVGQLRDAALQLVDGVFSRQLVHSPPFEVVVVALVPDRPALVPDDDAEVGVERQVRPGRLVGAVRSLGDLGCRYRLPGVQYRAVDALLRVLALEGAIERRWAVSACVVCHTLINVLSTHISYSGQNILSTGFTRLPETFTRHLEPQGGAGLILGADFLVIGGILLYVWRNMAQTAPDRELRLRDRFPI